jgi:adenine-specific DNA-methyltransferase
MPTLDWLDRNHAFTLADRVPTRLLEPMSVHHAAAGTSTAIEAQYENLLIQGDNLEALKALLPFYRGEVKCIFIDPPYNTKSAFEHYDDNLEHSQWLSMMLPRLQLLRELLREDGSIWVTIDDNEGHYLKVLMDEVFGRGNFVANIVWQSKDTPGNNATGIAETHNHVYCFARNAKAFRPSLLERNEEQLATYKNPDDDERGAWLGTPLTRAEYRERDFYPIKNTVGREVTPPKGSSWRRPPDKMRELASQGRIWWGKTGDAEFPMEKKFLSEVKAGVVNQTWWPYEFAGSTRNASAELKGIFSGSKGFDTPKPERLMRRILDLATAVSDLVLDSFLGSGTTAAVAQKMGRRWIGIEMGEHAVTHCLPRLRRCSTASRAVSAGPSTGAAAAASACMRLGDQVFGADGHINRRVRFAALAAFVWQQQTRTAYRPQQAGGRDGTPLLGVHQGAACYPLYNGILGDRRPEGGNVLTLPVLQTMKNTCWHDGPKVVYGEACRLGAARLAAERILFQQIPYDLRAR